MVCFRTTIAFNQHTVMTKSVNSTEVCSKSKNKKSPNSTNHLSVRSAAIDVVILIAVVSASGGLRKAAEFDIQIETEDCVVKNSSNLGRDCVKQGLFELHRDHHRELEAELKKMAPPNGRAVLLFKARCGCSVGRMEVWGMKKPRKIKK
ncbi:ribosomal protein L34e superfamily protein [Actinidia rufa]|uniref:Ribosomal protein L34e superfamily protein n=1 Tax=Actinidia rufa TaxID=165716 RepID=A0A7J0EEK8_9ERIC|nr:ribosomal protein L34e superfamily protein [Actinidia rufa]